MSCQFYPSAIFLVVAPLNIWSVVVVHSYFSIQLIKNKQLPLSWQYVGLSWTKFSSELCMWHDKVCLLTGITVTNLHKKQAGRFPTSTPGIFSKPKEGRPSSRVAWSASHLFIWFFSFSISPFPFRVWFFFVCLFLFFFLIKLCSPPLFLPQLSFVWKFGKEEMKKLLIYSIHFFCKLKADVHY